ncbi:arginase family protein [Leucobacter chromiireducens]|nr:arginase family protein [Leucobacter chromiireducens]
MGNTRNTVRLIGTPYGYGRRGHMFGSGPLVLLDDEQVPARLREQGITPDTVWVDAAEPEESSLQLPPGNEMTWYLNQVYALRERVAEARDEGFVPVLSSGNCNTSLGVIGGINDEGIGMLWLDAHSDASTPETSPSGFFDGMPVSIINGRSWKALREGIPGFHTIPTERIVSVGMHDLVPGRLEPVGALVDRAAANTAGSWRAALGAALNDLRQFTSRVYLHIDTDVLDTEVARVQPWPVSGGMTDVEVRETIEMVFDEFEVMAVNFTAFVAGLDDRAPGVLSSLVSYAAERALQQQQQASAR